jgi:hypothetical protein
MEQTSWVCCGLAHRTVFGAPGPHKIEPATLGKTKAHSAIIHRTIQCATGLSGEPAEQRLSARNSRLCQLNSAATVPCRSQSRKSEGHRTVRCRKKTKLQRSTELWTLIVGWRGVAPDTKQCLSGGAPDCLVHPSPAASPMATKVVEGYKYPQPPQLQASKFSAHLIQYKSSSIHS